MSDPTTLLALAKRCEQAAGPDRELDVAIAFACGIVTHCRGDCFYGKNRYCSVMVLEYDYYDTEYCAPELPHYTDSLDAAVTLVPKGWRWWINSSPFGRCWLVANDQIIDKAQSEKCATPALALCAAALRARTAMSQPSSDT